jgi:uncharacterized protein YndB with AHSA1/START domain
MKRTTNSTLNTKVIRASKEELYDAFIQPDALLKWQAPGDMKTKIHSFDLRVGGGYEMSLYYPDSVKHVKGKTKDNEDKFTVRFDELVKGEKIVQAINFDTTDPDFTGEMKMVVTFESKAEGVWVTIEFSDIPAGIKPEDNEAGTESSLEKLADFVSNPKWAER